MQQFNFFYLIKRMKIDIDITDVTYSTKMLCVLKRAGSMQKLLPENDFFIFNKSI